MSTLQPASVRAAHSQAPCQRDACIEDGQGHFCQFEVSHSVVAESTTSTRMNDVTGDVRSNERTQQARSP